jgi:hypothetical protein
MEAARATGAMRSPCFRRRTIRGTLIFACAHAKTTDLEEPGSDGSSKFIFDLLEPEPPKVDSAVLVFVKGHVFDPADYGADGGGKGLVNDPTGWSR